MSKKSKSDKKISKAKKAFELNLVAKENLKFKSFFGKRNSSKAVIVRPK